MKHNRIIELLQTFDFDYRPPSYGSEWFKIKCPFSEFTHEHGTDNKPSFGISESEGPSRYNCFSCGERGWLIDLPLSLQKHTKDSKTLNPIFEFIKNHDLEHVDITKPIEFTGHTKKDIVETLPWPEDYLDSFINVADNDHAIRYLFSRGLDARTIKGLGIVYDPRQNRVCFPFRDNDGSLAGLHGRAINPRDKLKYLAYKHNDTYNPHIWVNQHRIDTNKPVILVESVFDLASVYRVYNNVICSRSATIPYSMLFTIPKCPYIVTLYDNDEAGERSREFFKRNLSSANLIQIKPISGKKDPGEMSAPEVRSLLQKLFVINQGDAT